MPSREVTLTDERRFNAALSLLDGCQEFDGHERKMLDDLLLVLHYEKIRQWPAGRSRDWILITAMDLLTQICGRIESKSCRKSLVSTLSGIDVPIGANMELNPLITGQRAVRTSPIVLPAITELIWKRLGEGNKAMDRLEASYRTGTHKELRNAAEAMKATLDDAPLVMSGKTRQFPFGWTFIDPQTGQTRGDYLMGKAKAPKEPAAGQRTWPLGRTSTGLPPGAVIGGAIGMMVNSAGKYFRPEDRNPDPQPQKTVEPEEALHPDQQLAVARASFEGLQQAWLDYTLDAEDYFLKRPALRDTSDDADPAIAEYHRSWALAAEIVSEHPADPQRDARVTAVRAEAVSTAVASAWSAWDSACRRALELGNGMQEAKIAAASRRAVALIRILADPGTTGAYREHVASELSNKIDLLADPALNAHGPVDRRAVLELPELGGAASLLALTTEEERT